MSERAEHACHKWPWLRTTTLIARDGSPEGLWLMEHTDIGGTRWVSIRSRGLHWVNVTPQEAVEIAHAILGRYQAD